MDLLTLTAAALTFTAGVMRGFVGFGTPLFLAPLYVAVHGARVMVPLVAAIEVALSLFLAPRAARDCDWREVAWLWLGTLVGTPLGVYLLGIIDLGLVKRLVALVILVFALTNLIGWRYAGPRGPAVAIGCGIVGGVFTGLIGFAGPPAVLYLMSNTAAMARVRANLIVYFAGSSTMAVISFAAAGAYTRDVIALGGVYVPAVLLGAWAGATLYRGAGDQRARQVALWLLLVAGFAGLVF